MERHRRVALLGVLTALAIASGYAFAAVPNVKPISFVIFLAGACAGASGGLLVGTLGMGIYSVANPWGPAPPVVVVAKLAGAALFGLAGAAIGPRAARARSAVASGALLAAAGVVLTCAYGVIVDLATAVAIGMARNPIPTFVASLPFNAVHAASNGAIFAIAGPPLLRRFAVRPVAIGAMILAAAVTAAVPSSAADAPGAPGAAVEPARGPAPAERAATDSTGAPVDTVRADTTSADSGAAAGDSTRPRIVAPPFDSYGPLDTLGSAAVLDRAVGVTRGGRTPLEPFRETPRLAVERFGIVGSSERLLVLGEEGVALRLAGVPLLASRSGLAPFDALPTQALRAARVRGAAADPLLGARGAAGSVDWTIGPAAASEETPLTSLAAARGPLTFRRYQVGFDRWVGPARANVAYDASRDLDPFGFTLARARGTFLSVATRADAAVPVFVAGGGTRRELDLVAGPGAGAHGTEERSIVLARAAPGIASIGRARVAIKTDRVEWRATSDPGLRGHERESGGIVALGESAPVGAAVWGYSGRVVDDARARQRSTERVGGTAVAAGGRGVRWRLFAGAERVSPVSPRAHLGAEVARDAGRARVAFAAHRSLDHPPRGLLQDGDALEPARHDGVELSVALDSTLALTLFRRRVDDGLFLLAADPFFASPIRIDYDDWGAALDGAVRVWDARLSWGYLLLDDDAGDPLPLRARHRGHAECERAWVSAARSMRFVLRGGGEIVGDRAAFDRTTTVETTIDLRAAARLEIESVVLYVQAENLLDRYNPALPGVYPEGRGLYFGVTWLLKD